MKIALVLKIQVYFQQNKNQLYKEKYYLVHLTMGKLNKSKHKNLMVSEQKCKVSNTEGLS